MFYVIVGEVEVYVCTSDDYDQWLGMYRLYGVADTIDDVRELYRLAEYEVMM